MRYFLVLTLSMILILSTALASSSPRGVTVTEPLKALACQFRGSRPRANPGAILAQFRDSNASQATSGAQADADNVEFVGGVEGTTEAVAVQGTAVG